MKKTQITNYKGLKKFYFDKIINDIILTGNLRHSNKKVLDFGCGEKRLQFKLKKKILNYDINSIYSDFEDYSGLEFDIIVINHVLMYLRKMKSKNYFRKSIKNPKCEFLIGIGKQNFLSKLLKNITFNINAHVGTVSSYNEQLKIINENLKIIKKKNIYFMTDLIFAKFMNN